jgi:PAS domain
LVSKAIPHIGAPSCGGAGNLFWNESIRYAPREGTSCTTSYRGATFSLMGPPAEIASPLVLSLFAYWDRLRADRSAPSWRAIEPAAIKKCLPYLLVSEVFGEPFDLRFRLAGTELVSSYGYDPTGMTLREHDHASANDVWLALYGRLLSDKQPIFGRYVAQASMGEIFRVDVVMLPLSHDDRSVDRIIELEDWGMAPGLRRDKIDPKAWRFETLGSTP